MADGSKRSGEVQNLTDDQKARAALGRLCEPDDEGLGRFVEARGAVEVLRQIETGQLDSGRIAAYRARLSDLDVEADLRRAVGCGARLVTPGSPEWPSVLDDLGARRPLALWVVGAGNLAWLTGRAVAVVGARACTAYGEQVAAELAAGLGDRGWTVVSGAAFGIDAAAHRGALAGGGRTVAVLGCGPDVAYPALHRDLHRRIAEAGAVIAEHPPGTRPRKQFFPARNRIMAALGQVVVIVEAAQPSGSLITAEVAAGLGRVVGAVPGRIGARNAEGTNALIKDGAQLIRGARDVLDLLFGVGHPGHRREPTLEPRLAAVFELICEGTATLDRLAAEAELAPRAAAVAVSRLELLGLVAADPLGGWVPRGGQPP
jgi:DNA processing protein